MATWQINLADRPPVRVVVDDGRNLAAEHEAAVTRLRTAPPSPPRWKFWAEAPVPPDPFWNVTDEVRLPVGLVVGVLICKPVRTRPVHKPILGFSAE